MTAGVRERRLGAHALISCASKVCGDEANGECLPCFDTVAHQPEVGSQVDSCSPRWLKPKVPSNVEQLAVNSAVLRFLW